MACGSCSSWRGRGTSMSYTRKTSARDILRPRFPPPANEGKKNSSEFHQVFSSHHFFILAPSPNDGFHIFRRTPRYYCRLVGCSGGAGGSVLRSLLSSFSPPPPRSAHSAFAGLDRCSRTSRSTAFTTTRRRP